MKRALIEELVEDLDEDLRDALVLSATHSYAACAEKLHIRAEKVAERAEAAQELVCRRLLGQRGWMDTATRRVAIMEIDGVAVSVGLRRHSAWGWLARWLRERLGPQWEWQLGMGAVATLVIALAIGELSKPARDESGGGAPIATAGMGASAGGARRSEGPSGRRAAGVGVSRELGRPAYFANAVGGMGVEASAGRVAVARGTWQREIDGKWQERVENVWNAASGGEGRAGIREAEEYNARVGGLMEELRGLWVARVSADSQEGRAFRRQLEAFVQISTDGEITGYCAGGDGTYATGWTAMEEGRRGLEVRRRELEVRRRELEVERQALEVERREWEVRRRAAELRRRALELLRSTAEETRKAVEGGSRADSEEYWRGLEEYARVLDEYAGALENEGEILEEYRKFVGYRYVAGQQEYGNGMTEVIVGYSELLWRCGT